MFCWTKLTFLSPFQVAAGETRRLSIHLVARGDVHELAMYTGTDGRGSYNVYYFKNRDWRRLSSLGAPGPSGMMTEVRVYQTPLPAQTVVSQTYV